MLARYPVVGSFTRLLLLAAYAAWTLCAATMPSCSLLSLACESWPQQTEQESISSTAVSGIGRAPAAELASSAVWGT